MLGEGGDRLAVAARPAPFLLLLTMLLSGCSAGGGNAGLGPDPGGGFDCPNNAFEDCANP
jgi:hypothetical protein